MLSEMDTFFLFRRTFTGKCNNEKLFSDNKKAILLLFQLSARRANEGDWCITKKGCLLN